MPLMSFTCHSHPFRAFQRLWPSILTPCSKSPTSPAWTLRIWLGLGTWTFANGTLKDPTLSTHKDTNAVRYCNAKSSQVSMLGQYFFPHLKQPKFQHWTVPSHTPLSKLGWCPCSTGWVMLDFATKPRQNSSFRVSSGEGFEIIGPEGIQPQTALKHFIFWGLLIAVGTWPALVIQYVTWTMLLIYIYMYIYIYICSHQPHFRSSCLRNTCWVSRWNPGPTKLYQR